MGRVAAVGRPALALLPAPGACLPSPWGQGSAPLAGATRCVSGVRG